MIYEAPIDDDGNPYYVPIVIKNKDSLIGYLEGMNTTKDLIDDVLSDTDVNIDMSFMEPVLDSSRFNDLLESGKRESELSEEEITEYFYQIFKEVDRRYNTSHSENNIIKDDVLEVECTCDLGYYSWKRYDDIPEENFTCVNCGKVLIHYTDIYCHNMEYDYS